ncbi:MAG: patatin-like phospholipase family protein [Planctomycetota bacterium]
MGILSPFDWFDRREWLEALGTEPVVQGERDHGTGTFEDWRMVSMVVALGGGGARGIAHLGALEALQDRGVAFHRFVGVSIGALAAAVVARDGDVRAAIQNVQQYLDEDLSESCLVTPQPSSASGDGGLWGWYERVRRAMSAHMQVSRAVTRAGMLSDVPLRTAIERLIPNEIDIEELAIPTSIVAMDLTTGFRRVLETGPLRLALQASAAIPGLFPPVTWVDGNQLCDIGILESLPTEIARTYGQPVIAIDVGQKLDRDAQCQSAMEVMLRVDDIGESYSRRAARSAADILIRPEVGTIPWFDFGSPERLMQAGRESAERACQSIDSCDRQPICS